MEAPPRLEVFETESAHAALNRTGTDSPQSSSSHSARAHPPPVNLWTARNAGFVAQYFVVGLVYGGLPATLYGVLSVYLNVPGYVYDAGVAMATLPWSFKALYGALHDCVPIRGYRRKPYMSIGWAVCGVALLCLAALGLPPPYWCTDADGSYVTTCDAEHMSPPACANVSSAEQSLITQPAAPCNAAASEAGGSVTSLLFLACLGYVCADVAADGLTVSFAQREPMEIRGRTQSTVYFVRSIGQIVSYLLVGFGMNGRAYGGTFDFSLSFGAVCTVFAVPCFAMVPVSWCFVDEERQLHAPSTREYAQGVWQLLSSSFFLAVVGFGLIYAGIGGVGSPAAVNVQRYWAGVQNMQKQVFALLSQAVFAAGLAITRRYLLNYSWRRLLVGTILVIVALDAVVTSATVFDVVRNQYFFLGETFVVELPAATQFLVTTFVVVEAADRDNGGLVYGLLTTAHNIGLSFARPLSNQIFGSWRPSLSDSANFIRDKPSFRSIVMHSFLLSYGFSILSFVAIPLLPEQKAQAQQRKRTWRRSPRVGWATLLLLLTTFGYSVTLIALTMFPATSCLKLVGGAGC